MNEIASFPYIANCISAFSFLTSAVMMYLVHTPHAPMWRQLRRCKSYLVLVFLIVGLSCSKTVLLDLEPERNIVVTSTLISAGIQSMLFACTGITFVNPVWVSKRWIGVNLAIIMAYSSLLLMGLLLWEEAFIPIAILCCIVYFILLISYQFAFYGEYNRCISNTDSQTDENSEGSYKWIKHFFIAVSTLGVTAGIAPFMPVNLYYSWMLVAAVFYSFVVISFVNYCGSTANLVHKVYEAEISEQKERTYSELVARESTDSESATEMRAFGQLDVVLDIWVAEHGFVNNDLVTNDFARSLGVDITTMRAYFNKKYQMDFRQWRTKLRVDYACSILKDNPDYSYDAIAEMVGFGDRSNFMRTFRKITGMTPKEYAKKGQSSFIGKEDKIV